MPNVDEIRQRRRLSKFGDVRDGVILLGTPEISDHATYESTFGVDDGGFIIFRARNVIKGDNDRVNIEWVSMLGEGVTGGNYGADISPSVGWELYEEEIVIDELPV